MAPTPRLLLLHCQGSARLTVRPVTGSSTPTGSANTASACRLSTRTTGGAPTRPSPRSRWPATRRRPPTDLAASTASWTPPENPSRQPLRKQLRVNKFRPIMRPRVATTSTKNVSATMTTTMRLTVI